MHKSKFLTVLFFTLILGSAFSFAQKANYWEPTGIMPNQDVWSLASNSLGHIYAGTSAGVYKSTDDGNKWLQVGPELSNQFISSIAAKSSGIVFAGTSGNGVYRSTNDGSSWQLVLGGVDVRSIVFSNDGKIYAAAWGSYVYVTGDDGLTWQQIKNGLGVSLIRSVLFADGKLFAGTSGTGVYNSSDNGNNWNPSSNNSDKNIVCLAENNKDLYAGTAGTGMLKSTDKGFTWMQINQGLTDLFIRSINVSPDGKLFAGTFYNGVFRSTDNGNSWYRIVSGLTNWNVLSIIIRSDGKLFCGTNGGGIFRSGAYTKPIFFVDKDSLIFTAAKNGPTTPLNENLVISNIGTGSFNWNIISKPSWLNISQMNGIDNGVITVSVNNTDYPAGNKQEYIVYSSSTGTGNNPDSILVILKIISPLKSAQLINSNMIFSLSQNYPNPFNPETRIEYSLPENSFVSIIIYDTYGREVEKLVNKNQSPGSFSITWKPDNLPSGVYYYKLLAGKYGEMKKLVYLR